MKIYSDTLTSRDLLDACPAKVSAEIMAMPRPRVRASGWTVTLSGTSPHAHNSGQYGGGESHAATWDEHGEWMAALYEIDPAARVACYSDRDDFYKKTRDWQPKGMKAPWLANARPEIFGSDRTPTTEMEAR